jgi:cell division protease FtsH
VKQSHKTLLLWLLLIVMMMAIYSLIAQEPAPREVPFSDFVDDVRTGHVDQVEVTSRGTGEAEFAYYHTEGERREMRTTTGIIGDQLNQELLEHNVRVQYVSADSHSLWAIGLWTWLPTLLVIGLFVFFMRQVQASGGRAMSFGKSRARLLNESQNKVTFADVAGIDEAKAELAEVVDFLRDPGRYQRLGGVIPKGVLLVGPPGTGKTLLARAVAGEAGVPFFSASASEFVEAIVGVGAARVRDLFMKARQAAPAIIFIDELDAIGRTRAAGVRLSGNDEQEQTLNQILTEMDGFDNSGGVIVLAATNRADVLDQALLRPGRFDRRVMVQPPDRAGREAILRIHSRNVPLAHDVDLRALAAQTAGFVGADLRNLVNEAALLAARRNENEVTMADFNSSIEKVLLGAERKIMLTAADRERVAYHEGGHALLGLLVPGADPVRKVTIVPRGQALGVTVQSPDDDRFNYSEEYLRARVTGALGGRAAEAIVYGVVTTGAENDLQQVTMIARNMVVRWGMSPRVGPLAFPTEGGWQQGQPVLDKPYSDETAALIDSEMKRIVEECLADAMRLLREHRPQLDSLARALLKDESLGEEEILRVTGIAPQSHAAFSSSPRPESSVEH